MKTRFAPVSKKNDLFMALQPYAEHWAEWIDSHACFLSIRELVLIRVYQRTGSYATCADVLKSDIITVANDLLRIMSRLSLRLHEYRDWELLYFMEQYGVYKYKSETERFLKAPIYTLPVSQHLKTRLKLIGEGSIWHVLNKHSERALVEYWGAGSTTLHELKRALFKRNLGYLLNEHRYLSFDSS